MSPIYIYIWIGVIRSCEISSSHIRAASCAPVQQILPGAYISGGHDTEALPRGANADGSVLFKPFEAGKYKL